MEAGTVVDEGVFELEGHRVHLVLPKQVLVQNLDSVVDETQVRLSRFGSVYLHSGDASTLEIQKEVSRLVQQKVSSEVAEEGPAVGRNEDIKAVVDVLESLLALSCISCRQGQVLLFESRVSKFVVHRCKSSELEAVSLS